MRSPTRFVKPERNAQKKNLSFPNMVSPMTSSPADRLSFSSFDNMVSYRQHLRYFCRRKKFFFFYKSSFQPKHLSFSPNYAWYVTHIHYPNRFGKRKKKKEEKNISFFSYIFFLLTFPFPLQ